MQDLASICLPVVYSVPVCVYLCLSKAFVFLYMYKPICLSISTVGTCFLLIMSNMFADWKQSVFGAVIKMPTEDIFGSLNHNDHYHIVRYRKHWFDFTYRPIQAPVYRITMQYTSLYLHVYTVYTHLILTDENIIHIYNFILGRHRWMPWRYWRDESISTCNSKLLSNSVSKLLSNSKW